MEGLQIRTNESQNPHLQSNYCQHSAPTRHYNAEYENMVQYYYYFVGTDHRHETRAGSHQTCSQLPFNLLNGLFWIVFPAEVVISFIITLSVTVQPLLYRT